MAIDATGVNAIGSGVSAIGSFIASQRAMSAARKQQKQLREATKQAQQEIVNTGEEEAQQLLLRSFAALQDASAVEQASMRKAEEERRLGRSVASSIEAATAASGLELVGSPLLALGQSVYESEKRAAFTAHVGSLQARQFSFEAEQLVRASRLARAESVSKARAVGIQGAAQSDQVSNAIFQTRTAQTNRAIDTVASVGQLYKKELGQGYTALQRLLATNNNAITGVDL